MDSEVLNIYEMEQGSEAWFEERAGRITASKFKDLMSGMSTGGFKGLINNKIGEILSGTIEATYTNETMQRGIDMEPEAANEYAEAFNTEVFEVGFVTNEQYFPQYVGVSPDRFVPESGVDGWGLVEIKCPMMKTHIGYLKSNKLPNEYKWQVQGQLLITGASYCDFVSYYPGIKMLVVRVEPDLDMHDELMHRFKFAVDEIEEGLKLIRR